MDYSEYRIELLEIAHLQASIFELTQTTQQLSENYEKIISILEMMARIKAKCRLYEANNKIESRIIEKEEALAREIAYQNLDFGNVKNQQIEKVVNVILDNKVEHIKHYLDQYHFNARDYQNLFIRNAVFYSALESVKYLLTSPELEEHADIHNLNDYCFSVSQSFHHDEIMYYLIIDYDIEKTSNIKKMLEEDDYYEPFFEAREIKKRREQLEQEVEQVETKKKIFKI